MTPQQPHEFAALLIQKLEAVKQKQESEEKLSRMVADVSLSRSKLFRSLIFEKFFGDAEG